MGTLIGILVIGLLCGCGDKENVNVVLPTPVEINRETAVSQEIQSDDKLENSGAEDLEVKRDEEVVDSETNEIFDDEELGENSEEPEAQPAVDEDKMPVGKCIYCGEKAVYVSGAWCCTICPSVYGDEDIIAANLEDWIYVGEYMDCDVYEPNLEIAKGDDGKYIVQIGIYRLAALSDGIGELTPEGLSFAATDPAGNPISGMITVEGGTATVMITASTWEYLTNGMSLQYIKTSVVPNIWEY